MDYLGVHTAFELKKKKKVEIYFIYFFFFDMDNHGIINSNIRIVK